VAGGPAWTIAVEVAPDAVGPFCAALEGFGSAISAFEVEEAKRWRVEVYATTPPDSDSLVAAVALAARMAEVPEPKIRWTAVPESDWLAQNRASFVPIRVGRYFVHSAHFEGAPPAGTISLAIDAGAAFGTGSHASTRGCLMALDWLASRWRHRGRRPTRLLDLGCGSGILALAMARTWRQPVVAADLDPVALRITAENARRNGVQTLVRTCLSDGFRYRCVSIGGPYDLIVANILARPLIRMAPDLRRHLAIGGIAILSGLLGNQGGKVRAACQRQDIRFIRKETPDGWQSLVLTR
jgi:ribosomal protein L11 methyltransferase